MSTHFKCNWRSNFRVSCFWRSHCSFQCSLFLPITGKFWW